MWCGVVVWWCVVWWCDGVVRFGVVVWWCGGVVWWCIVQSDQLSPVSCECIHVHECVLMFIHVGVSMWVCRGCVFEGCNYDC